MEYQLIVTIWWYHMYHMAEPYGGNRVRKWKTSCFGRIYVGMKF